MAFFIRDNSGTASDISSEKEMDSWSPAVDGEYDLQLRLRGLNGAAATLSLTVNINDGTSDYVMAYWAEAKKAAADETFATQVNGISAKSTDTISWKALSSNSGDTAVVPRSLISFSNDLQAVYGDRGSASDFRTMLDGTGGQVLSLGQLVINSSAAGGAIDIDNSNGSAIKANGTTHGFEIVASAGPGIEIDGTASGIEIAASGGPGIDIRGTIYGIYCLASGGPGIYTMGASAGMESFASATAGVGFYAAGGAGAGYGIRASGGGAATAAGIYAQGGGTSGPGIKAEARGGNDAGMELVKHGTGKDIDADEIDNILDDTGTSGVVVAAASKTGYALAAAGLDSITVTEPTGVATTFRGMMVQLWRRFFKRTTMTTSQIKTYKNDGTTVVTTQAIADDGITQDRGAST